jgi:hypothetical protein
MDGSLGNLPALAKPRSGIFVPAVAVLMTLCLSAAVLAYYFAAGAMRFGGELPQPTDATRPVSLTIGSTRFRIPANYIVLASERRGGALNEVTLAAMLPRLDAYSLAVAEEYAGNAPDSPIVHLRIQRERVPLPEPERLERIYRLQFEDAEGEAQPDGSRRFSFRAGSGYRGQELFAGIIDGRQIALLCDRVTATTPSPNCIRDIPFGAGLGLSYRFKRAHIAQWREIDSAVKTLLNGFVESD